MRQHPRTSKRPRKISGVYVLLGSSGGKTNTRVMTKNERIRKLRLRGSGKGKGGIEHWRPLKVVTG